MERDSVSGREEEGRKGSRLTPTTAAGSQGEDVGEADLQGAEDR